jgi:tripartite-type tricarboxylate transporter receptor subunit TctC
MSASLTRRALGALLASVLLAAHPAAAAPLDPLKGQTIRFIIAAPGGNATDRTGRTFAGLLGKLVPDATIRVQNLGEAAGGVGVAEVQNASGNVITFGMVNNGVVYAQLAGRAEGQYDLSKLRWLGATGGNLKVMVMRPKLGAPGLDTLLNLDRQPLMAVSGGAGTAGNTEALLINAVTPLKMKIVGGLEDALVSTMLIAGDLDGTMRNYAAIKPLIDAGDVVPVLLYTRNGFPDAFAKVPTLAEVAQRGKYDAIVELVSSIPRGMFMAAPATTADQLAALRAAWEQIVADPEFQATLTAEDRSVKITAGAGLERMLIGFFGAGSDFRGLVAQALECGQRVSDGDLKACP